MEIQKENDLKHGLRISKKLRSQFMLIIGMLIVFFVFNVFLDGRLLTSGNLIIILSHTVFPALVAWGMSFMFTTGITDLSVGANIILAANIGCLLATKYEMGIVGLTVGAIIAAIIMEQITVRCTLSLGVPSWIAGLGMALVYEAILANYTWSNNIMGIILDDKYRTLGNMPELVIVYVVAFIIAYIIFNRTTIGMNIKAVGANENVAASMGISKKKTIAIGALFSGIFIGAAAVIQLSYAGRIDATTGLGSLNMIFQSLACVLLAGSIASIFSMPVAILICSFFVMSIFNILTMFGVPSGTGQEIFLGLIMVVCGVLSHLKYKEVVK